MSNPPYIPESDKISILPNVLEYEPHLALFVPDSDPLLFYIKIMDFALLAGKPGCKLYFEIHEKYGKEIQELFEKKGFERLWLGRINRLIKVKLIFTAKRYSAFHLFF